MHIDQPMYPVTLGSFRPGPVIHKRVVDPSTPISASASSTTKKPSSTTKSSKPSSSAHPSSISFANDPTQSVIAFPDPTTTSTTTTSSSSTTLNLFPTITTTTSSSSTIETASALRRYIETTCPSVFRSK